MTRGHNLASLILPLASLALRIEPQEVELLLAAIRLTFTQTLEMMSRGRGRLAGRIFLSTTMDTEVQFAGVLTRGCGAYLASLERLFLQAGGFGRCLYRG